jgi:hypothetical protein
MEFVHDSLPIYDSIYLLTFQGNRCLIFRAGKQTEREDGRWCKEGQWFILKAIFLLEDGGSNFLRNVGKCQTIRSHIPETSQHQNHRRQIYNLTGERKCYLQTCIYETIGFPFTRVVQRRDVLCLLLRSCVSECMYNTPFRQCSKSHLKIDLPTIYTRYTSPPTYATHGATVCLFSATPAQMFLVLDHNVIAADNVSTKIYKFKAKQTQTICINSFPSLTKT